MLSNRSSERSQSSPCHDQLVTDSTGFDPDAADGSSESSGLPRLLLVEDDRALGPLLVEVLAEQHQVDHAPDGQAGLHLALTRTTT